MTNKILRVFICLTAILQTVAFEAAAAPLPANKYSLLGAYTSVSEYVNSIIVSDAPLGEQINAVSTDKTGSQIQLAIWETRRLEEQVLKLGSLLYYLNPAICSDALTQKNREEPKPPGRLPGQAIFLLLFAVVLALSNLPAPAFCLFRKKMHPACRKSRVSYLSAASGKYVTSFAK